MDKLTHAKLKGDPEARTVNLTGAIDISCPPQDPRISFPYPNLTPAFEVLRRERVAELLGPASWLGATSVLGATSRPSALGMTESSASGERASTLPSISAAIISEAIDVSSSQEGVCRVTANVWGRWNAHAGTHADRPAHWLAEPPFPDFADAQYQGAAMVVDLSARLARRPCRRIGRADLEAAFDAEGIDPGALRRLLLRTYRATPTGWDPDFAHLTPEAARWLGDRKRLVLVGLDTPSVDAPSAAPIHACAHGGLWAGRVAILEGLRLDHVTAGNYWLQVVWNPMLDHIDARGGSAFLYARP